MLKIRRMWKNGRFGVHFSNILCIFVEIMFHHNWLQSGNLALLLRIACAVNAGLCPMGPTET
jgi:hypothetical protein